MSLITLSMTAATYLYFQHEDYTSFDKRWKRRTPGLNDPSLLNILVCTVLYIVVNAPRIFANALILSVSPRWAIIMMFLEFIINLIVCNKLALPLKKNAIFPSGFISAAINYACPCYPIKKIGQINLWSTLLIMLKLLSLYPILYTKSFTLKLDQKPNILQCWDVTEVQQEKSTIHIETYPHLKNLFNGERFITCKDLQDQKYVRNKTSSFNFPRFCACDEGPNDVLFEYIIPMTILALFYSILFGVLITSLIRRTKLTYLQSKVSKLTSSIKTFVCQLIKCGICCKDDKSSKNDGEVEMDPKKEELTFVNYDEDEQMLELAPWWFKIWSSFLLNVRTMFDFSRTSEENSK